MDKPQHMLNVMGINNDIKKRDVTHKNLKLSWCSEEK